MPEEAVPAIPEIRKGTAGARARSVIHLGIAFGSGEHVHGIRFGNHHAA